jgi:DNA-binding MarR family transcriptional regulator
LTARLDREADRILRTEQGLSYSRFLLLWSVGELDGPTQRALAERLGLTEPSVSRMTSVLASEGLLVAEGDPRGGNRRRLVLTDAGQEAVVCCGALLEATVDAVVAEAGLSYGAFRRDVGRLLAALEQSA